MTSDRAGSLFCQPAFISALAILLLNDHYLKATNPSWVTGKLSDLAGLVVAPIALVSTIEILRSFVGRQPFERLRAMTATSLVVGGLFALVQIVPLATRMYAAAAGATSHIALNAVGRSAGSGPAAVTADLTDLLTLPALAVPILLVLRPGFAWQRLAPSGTDPALPL